MDRRDFFKILTTSSAGLASTACGPASEKLIPLLVSEREIVPGEEAWHPAVCTECAAGCGVIVRVMRGEHRIERNGEKLREPVACIKKVEGNPLDPVSGGRLCARGQALVQGLYHPDRLRGPQRRNGPRGAGQFATVSWEDAIADVAGRIAKTDRSSIVFLTEARSGTRAIATQRFLQAIGAPAAITCSISAHALERKAALLVFGWNGLPVYDLAHARYAVGIGADFLGGWASPVFYGRQFGNFRQGRLGIRGKLVQAESRFSITAQSADQWLPLRPGSELQFAVAIMCILLDEKLRNAEALPKAMIEKIYAADLGALIRSCGVEEKRVRQLARELGESEAPLVIHGASIIQSNSLQALIAASYLNIMLGNIGKPGGVMAPAESGAEPERRDVIEAIGRATLLFVDGVNPAYLFPDCAGALGKVESIVSLSPFLDDTGVYADLLLPDHHSLESAVAIVPSVAASPAVTVSTPFVRPLYATRATEQTLGDIAKKAGVTFEAVTPKAVVEEMLPEGRTWDEVIRDGGLWLDSVPSSHATGKREDPALEWTDAAFPGAVDHFPYHFQAYCSVQFGDGRGANLPWMQEMPDPVSSAMWGLPVEIDPKTAAQFHLKTGDMVRVESPHGKIEAPVYVHPAAVPGVISMGIGGGHTMYGRYASHRGANPLTLVDAQTAMSTRVRLTRLNGSDELIQFSRNDRDHGPFGDEHR